MNRRNFLLAGAGTLGAMDLLGATDAPFTRQLEKHISTLENMSIAAAAEEEDFWGWIRESYTVSPNVINLNNGGVSPQPKVVQDAHIRYYQYCNEAPSYYMWRILDQGRDNLRLKLAALCGVLPEEIAINRNATEGLNTVIFGLDLKEGDEVVLNKFDYPNMVNAWKQREKRDKIKLVWVETAQPAEDEQAIVQAYEKAITPKTKIVHITHMINWTGNLLPSRAIADMAHKHGCEVIVDAAHSFAQIDMKLTDTGADYLATSLHKWLSAPFGSGLMYIKKDKIKNVWALLSSVEPDGGDMKKFESLGTRSFASEMAIGAAADFYAIVGARRKEARLRYLKNYWVEKVNNIPNLKLYTSLKPAYSCAIATVGLEGWKPQQFEAALFEKYRIHTVSMVHEGINAIRVTPNVYTTTQELDLLVKGIHELAKMEAPVAKEK